MSCSNIKLEFPKSGCETELKPKQFSIKNGDIYRNGELFAKFISQEGDIVTCEIVAENKYLKGQKVTTHIVNIKK